MCLFYTYIYFVYLHIFCLLIGFLEDFSENVCLYVSVTEDMVKSLKVDPLAKVTASTTSMVKHFFIFFCVISWEHYLSLLINIICLFVLVCFGFVWYRRAHQSHIMKFLRRIKACLVHMVATMDSTIQVLMVQLEKQRIMDTMVMEQKFSTR